MIDFNLQKKNIEILLGNYYNDNLENDVFKIEYDINQVVVFFDEIYNLKNKLYKMDNKFKLIKDINNFGSISPKYIHGGGSEPINYIDFKKNMHYRYFDLDNILLNLALIYNTIVVFEDLYIELYANIDNIYQSNSPILDYEKKEFTIVDYESFDNLFFDKKNNRNKNFDYTMFKRIKTSSSKINTLEVDIESFFANIYTHNLENLSKSNLFDGYKQIVKKYFCYLDALVRKSNFNRTKGIIIGPLMSSIVSELFLLSIDFEIKKFIKTSKLDIRYIRYVDDYKFYSDEVNELKILLNFLRKNFEKHHLYINSEKTRIHTSLMNVDISNLDELLVEYPYLDNKFNKEYIFLYNEINKINLFIDSYFEKGSISQVKTFFTLFIKKCNKKLIKFENSSDYLFLENLLKIGFKYPVLLSRIYRLIDIIVGMNNDVIKIINDKNIYINRWYNDTIVQIQHYYILNKYCNNEMLKKNLDTLFNQYVSLPELCSSFINPLVFCTFIKKNNIKIQDKIIKYIEEQYCESTSTDGISFSKWWIVFKKIYQNNTRKKDPLNLFKNRDGTPAFDKLYYSKIVKI